MIDLSKPRWDQSKYMGRLKHFLNITNPLNILATGAMLDEAKAAVDSYKHTGQLPAGYDEEKLWKAKYLYDSAFHPDTGEKMIVIGRMSAQVPMNTMICGFMITFYKTTGAVVFWQWINQTFNAIVNFTNRSGKSSISKEQLLASYVGACGGALSTALYLNSRVKVRYTFFDSWVTNATAAISHMNPLIGRLVPFVAVAAANCINIPMMRSNELFRGTEVYTKENHAYVGKSARAAALGITLVVFSRIIMATPALTFTPYLTNRATLSGLFDKYPKYGPLWFQLFVSSICFTFAVPACCAIFEQKANMNIWALEPELRDIVAKINPHESHVVFNKGL